MKVSPFYVHTSFAFNLLEISVLWVKASPGGRLHPSIGAARTGWKRVKARVKAKTQSFHPQCADNQRVARGG